MASLPPQRRASPPAEALPSSLSSPPPHQEEATRSSSFSAASVDSQTLLLDSPHAEADAKTDAETDAEADAEAQNEAPQASVAPQPHEDADEDADEDEEPRRCWICFNDETEDDATSSEWRAPCTCSLVAHEKCLLDWIADMEAPTAGRRAGRKSGKILCPQCKAEIRVQRPRSVVVDSVRVVEKLAGTLLLPGFAFVTGTALYSTLTLAGTQTIYAIFGTQDAAQILGPLYQAPTPGMPSSLAIRLLDHLRHHWRLDVGLPLIPAILVASRTTLADSFLPFLPLIFFVSSGQPGDEMLQLQWPPSAAFSFAALPYLRGFYNAYYDRIWAPREQQWLKEIQPRAGTDDAADAGGLQFELGAVHDHDHDHDHEHDHDHDHDHEHDHDHDHDRDHDHDHHHHDHHHEVDEVLEVEVDFNIFGDWNNGGADHNHDVVEPAPPVEPAHPLNAPPLADEDQAPHAHEQAAPPPDIPAQPRRQRARRERNIAFSTTSLADTILGALIFPSIAAAMGELLRVSLPTSWVSPPVGAASTSWLGGWMGVGSKMGAKGRPTGFLQTRWGRSLVGGCLFVGLKDAIMLYVRWKMAQNHRRRKVLDHDGGRKSRSTAQT